MRLNRLSPLIAFVFCAPALSEARPPAANDSPTAVVQELYRVHKKGYGHLFDREGMSKLGLYFDHKMTALIRKNILDTPKDEVGNLDFDPLYNAQDIVISNFRVHPASRQGDRATVLVTFRNDTRDDRINFLMRRTKSGWRISDLDYGKGESLSKILSHPL